MAHTFAIRSLDGDDLRRLAMNGEGRCTFSGAGSFSKDPAGLSVECCDVWKSANFKFCRTVIGKTVEVCSKIPHRIAVGEGALTRGHRRCHVSFVRMRIIRCPLLQTL